MHKSNPQVGDEQAAISGMMDILERQLVLFEQSADLQSFEAFGQLHQQWGEQARLVEDMLARNALDRNHVIEVVGRMSDLNDRIEAALRRSGRDLVQQMGNVKQQQKILHTYGGVAQHDSVPLYFDEKN